MDVTLPEREYLDFLDRGKFMIQRCRDNGAHVFYPRVAEPRSGSTNLEWVEASGLGTVYSTTVVRAKPPAQNYNIVLIDLQEGVRMMSRVEGIAPEIVRIGLKVKAKIVRQDEQPVVIFEPLAD